MSNVSQRLTRLEDKVSQPAQHNGLFILPAEVLSDPEARAELLRKHNLRTAIFLPLKEDGSGMAEYSTVRVFVDDENEPRQATR